MSYFMGKLGSGPSLFRIDRSNHMRASLSKS